ncbi:MAG: cupin domain-containing protein [Thermomicrobiales bacterium]
MAMLTQTGAIVVGKGQGRTLTAHNNSVELKVTGAETGGDYALLDYHSAAGFPGPAPHIHERTDELFYVLEGEVTFWVGGETSVAGAGTSVFIPRGVPHTFSTPTGPARFLNLLTPAGFEGYFVGLAEAVARNDGRSLREIAAEAARGYDILLTAAHP